MHPGLQITAIVKQSDYKIYNEARLVDLSPMKFFEFIRNTASDYMAFSTKIIPMFTNTVNLN